MSQPLLPWSSADNASHPQVVWRSKLDNKYLIEVQRIDGYHAKLCIFDHDKNDQEIFSLNVGLSYGAPFGPDVADVQEWQEKVVDFIDNTNSK